MKKKQIRPVAHSVEGKNASKAGAKSDPGEPTKHHLVQTAAMLSAAPQNQGKTPLEMIQLAEELYRATAILPTANSEMRILLTTASKMRDDENLFKIAPASNRKRNSAPLITPKLWMRRVSSFPGSKPDLFLGLLRTRIPTKTLLKELFGDGDVVREGKLKKLLLFRTEDSAVEFVYQLTDFLTESQPSHERDSLLFAIKDLDLGIGMRWMKENEFKHPNCSLDLTALISNLREVKERDDLLLSSSSYVSALLSRWLVHARQGQISFIRSKVGKKG